ncbi:MAG: class I SAM-dependent methyltransferase, partial [Candidatus Hydrogenedentes bacterium]|nr:class I SAM-dependent methyltransferase [Candidatus Hydrogenedentota bacterium]
MIPQNATVLDVGCGNGSLAAGILLLRPDIHVEGIDIETVPSASIDIHYYDGKRIPFPDHSWDVCMANDVIHHCNDAKEILEEICRVA